jgi:uncharacterized protein
MIRIVADTTILVSAFLTPRGVAAEVLRRARRGAFRISLAERILEEAEQRLLYRRKIRKAYPYPDARVARYIGLLRIATEVIADLPPLTGVVRDPNDDMVIACALAAAADYLVTRDKDLLSLGSHEGIRMVTPRQFLDLLDAGA